MMMITPSHHQPLVLEHAREDVLVWVPAVFVLRLTFETAKLA
jgi:hypothetical protein